MAEREWTAIVDTGFNGDVALRLSLRRHVNARFLSRIHSLLASGQVVEEDCYLADFVFDDRKLTVQATFSPGNEILIGTNLLSAYRLEIDFHQRALLLKRVV